MSNDENTVTANRCVPNRVSTSSRRPTTSSTVSPDLRDRIQTITDAFVVFDESRVTDGGDPTFGFDQHDIENRLERLCEHRVPADEAVRTLVRKACADADLERADLSDDIARLANSNCEI